MTEDMPNFIGRKYDEVLAERAQVPGLAHEWTLRVAKRDDVHVLLTRDFDPKRIDLFIEDGVIVRQTIG